jgi:hypothetical protein
LDLEDDWDEPFSVMEYKAMRKDALEKERLAQKGEQARQNRSSTSVGGWDEEFQVVGYKMAVENGLTKPVVVAWKSQIHDSQVNPDNSATKLPDAEGDGCDEWDEPFTAASYKAVKPNGGGYATTAQATNSRMQETTSLTGSSTSAQYGMMEEPENLIDNVSTSQTPPVPTPAPAIQKRRRKTDFEIAVERKWARGRLGEDLDWQILRWE